MPQAIFLDEAREELGEIWRSIAKGSGSDRVADRFTDKIIDAAESFAEQPDSGIPREEISPSIRAFIVGRYVILYRKIPQGIEVTQIIHGARDIPTHYRY